MAVLILNDMPDAAVHRGDRDYDLLRELNTRREVPRFSGRTVFMAATIVLHLVAVAAITTMRQEARIAKKSESIIAVMLDAPRTEEVEAPPEYIPPPANVVYALETPPDLSFESDAITTEATTSAIATPSPQVVTPPLIESIEYVRVDKPVFPRESARKREYGTVVLRVLVDTLGRPAQIQIERSSGYSRLDTAARRCVEKFLFRPHEVNGVAQAAQVLIPVGFDPPA